MKRLAATALTLLAGCCAVPLSLSAIEEFCRRPSAQDARHKELVDLTPPTSSK